jgi:hypothetical protein
MHEGVFVCSKLDTEASNPINVLVCNKSAQNIIKLYVAAEQNSVIEKHSDIFKKVSFVPIKILSNETNDSSAKSVVVEAAESEIMSLEQIILSQLDEPNQKTCIYKIIVQEKNDEGSQSREKFYQVRVKSIEFYQKRAIAVYLYD